MASCSSLLNQRFTYKIYSILLVFSSNIGNMLHFTIEDVIAEGEQVVARYTVRGTNSGDAYPSNRQADHRDGDL